ncbi:MAG: phosphate regulon transcriptional regulator PhoB [Rhodobacteraceae bacterium]|nr:phosphate regulon transcriptional regulator PhoB [Paracoccaceae bacterium]
MAKPTILVVEDEQAQRLILQHNLEEAGYEVVTAEDGEVGLEHIKDYKPDIIVLDWMMPKLSGIELCRQIKSASNTKKTPVIMLSARSEEVDRIRGLEIGADDYISKPYSIKEILVRIKGQLRRVREAAVAEKLSFEGIELNMETYKVIRSGEEIKLGPTEFRLLATFLEKPGKVWSRDALLDRVWGRDIYVDTRTVDVHIGRLRRALCKNGEQDLVRTVRGAGYALG